MVDRSGKPFFEENKGKKYYTYCICLLPEVKDNCICKICNNINIEYLYNLLSNRKWNRTVEHNYVMILPAPYVHTGISCVSIETMCTKCDHLHLHSEELCYFYPKCECQNGDSIKLVLNVDAYARFLQLGSLLPTQEIKGL